MIKAIETKYKGYRFRSRLEARWAIFFDVLRIEWEYEKEGYELPSGKYLPDFWLPSLQCWCEIKPVVPTPLERSLCMELARGTDHPVVVAVGTPGDEKLHVYCADATDGSGGEQWWNDATGWCPLGPHWSLNGEGEPCICSGNDWSSRDFYTPRWHPWSGMLTVRFSDHSGEANRIIGRAHQVARSARFEHGETPRIV